MHQDFSGQAEQVVFGLEFFPDRLADAPIGSGDHDYPLRVLFHYNFVSYLVNFG